MTRSTASTLARPAIQHAEHDEELQRAVAQRRVDIVLHDHLQPEARMPEVAIRNAISNVALTGWPTRARTLAKSAPTSEITSPTA